MAAGKIMEWSARNRASTAAGGTAIALGSDPWTQNYPAPLSQQTHGGGRVPAGRG